MTEITQVDVINNSNEGNLQEKLKEYVEIKEPSEEEINKEIKNIEADIRNSARSKIINEDALKHLLPLVEKDQLTEILNKRGIISRAKGIHAHSIRTGEIMIAFIADMDDFKKNINDKFGHLVGDKALQFSAKLLESALRTTDSVGRWGGGDEFCGYLVNTNLTGAMNFKRRLEKLIRTNGVEILIANKIVLPDNVNKEEFIDSIKFTFGFGSNSEGQSLEKMFENADKNLRINKEHKKVGR
jgi:diguanylate cyclase (GGDEF)-like protein